MNSTSQIPKNLKSKESKLNERRNKKKIENSIKNTQKEKIPMAFNLHDLFSQCQILKNIKEMI